MNWVEKALIIVRTRWHIAGCLQELEGGSHA